MYIFYLAFYKKEVSGVKKKKKKKEKKKKKKKKRKVCSPRPAPAPTIQSSLLHSTKPKESFRGRVRRHLGSRSSVTDTGRWQLIQKWSNIPHLPLRNRINKKKKKRQNHFRRRGSRPSLTQVKTVMNQNPQG